MFDFLTQTLTVPITFFFLIKRIKLYKFFNGLLRIKGKDF